MGPLPWAWKATGRPSSWTVAVIDSGRAHAGHEDLNVAAQLGSSGVEDHATHVAGLACARENGFRAAAVDSGWIPRERLERARPDALFDDFTDVAAVIEALGLKSQVGAYVTLVVPGGPADKAAA